LDYVRDFDLHEVTEVQYVCSVYADIQSGHLIKWETKWNKRSRRNRKSKTGLYLDHQWWFPNPYVEGTTELLQTLGRYHVLCNHIRLSEIFLYSQKIKKR